MIAIHLKKILFLLLPFYTVYSQVSPPGLGDTNSASWFATGLRQNLNKSNTIESMTYAGIGFTSGNENYNPLNKHSIIIINEEISHQIKNWKLSYALSYRNQKQEEKSSTSNDMIKSTQQEFRVYGKIAHSTKVGKFKFTQTARQELRRFVDGDWKNTDEPVQIRTRFKTQATLSIDKEKKHSLTAGAEVLFSSSKDNFTKDWSKFQYKEARFTAFYTFRPKELPVAISAGYMNNLIEKNSTHSVHYASVDIVWENPFQFLKSK